MASIHQTIAPYTVEDIEPGALRQRRNLLFVSIGIIAYYLAGGDIKSMTTFAGVIPVKRPEIIVYGMWVILVYSAWRYALYTKNAFLFFKDSLIVELTKNKKFKELMVNLENERRACGESDLPHHMPIIKTGFFTRELDFTRSERIDIVRGQKTTSDWSDLIKIKVPYFKIFPVEVYCHIRAIFFDRAFGDYLLPYVLFSVAVITIFFHLMF